MSALVPEAGVSVLAGIPGAWVDDVVEALGRSGITPKVETREPQVMASIEWLMPTAALLYLANRYVGTLVSEAAKEHYPHIKRGVARFAERVSTLQIARMGSPSGKVGRVPPGNFTLVLGTDSGRGIRFIFPADRDLYEAALGSLFVILEDSVRRESAVTTFMEKSQDGRFAWRLIGRYSTAAADWVLVDPLTGTEWPI